MGLSPCFLPQNNSFPNQLDPLCSKCSRFVWRDWSRGKNFIFVVRKNLILNFSFIHQASTYVNYTVVSEQTPCWATLGQITLFVSRSPGILQYSGSIEPLLGKVCILQTSQRLREKTGIKKSEGTYCAALSKLHSKLLRKPRVQPGFAFVLVSHSLKIRIRNLLTDYSIYIYIYIYILLWND